MADRKYYVCVLEQGDSGYGITFPDFPGCVSAGDTFAEAAAGAHEALALHVEGMVEDGDALPEPTPPNEIEGLDWRYAMLVEAVVPDKPERINVSLDRGLLERIDRGAELRGMTRSAFLSEGARVLLGQMIPARDLAPSAPREMAAQDDRLLVGSIASGSRRGTVHG